MSEKILNWRNVAIALGIVCVLLTSLLIGSIHIKNTTIASLKSQVADLIREIDSLNQQIAELNSIIKLKKSTVWVDYQTVSESPSSYVYWEFSASYAGYIAVAVHSSTTDKTYVCARWSSYGVNYDECILVGVSGTAFFPVLPTSSVEVWVGNENVFSGATQTVTIVYYY